MIPVAIFSCDDEVRRILDSLPCECPCIDYKQIPYINEKKFEFIIDVVALLNCEEAMGYDRYIIIGVKEENHQYKRIGLKPTMPPMQDDNELQALVDLIRPRPIVHAGTINFDDESYGYIHISSENNSRTYEVAKTFPETTHKVHEGQAFIRIGTTKKVMTKEDRIRVESKVEHKYIHVSPLVENPLRKVNKSSLTIDLVAALIGTWNSQYEGDKNIIEQLSCMQYEDWEIEFQRRLACGDDNITFCENRWSYQAHVETLISNAKAYFDPHMAGFYDLLNDVFHHYDDKFDLPNNERFIISSNKPRGKYSEELRKALILTFVNIAIKEKQFTSCSKYFIKRNANDVITNLFAEATWQVFASLNWQLVNIAQADPDAFCISLQNALKKPNNAISQLLIEKEQGIIATGYYHGLVSALQTLAFCEEHFATASFLLFSLAMMNEEIKNSFVTIFLPWYPQTEASARARIGVIKQLVAEKGAACWDVIYKLMPRQTLSSMDINPPEFLECSYERKEITIDEYWYVTEQYLDQLIIISRSNPNFIVQLIDLLGDVNKSMFTKILELITELSTELQDSNKSYLIWDKLISFTQRHRRFSESDWSLPEDILKEIDHVVKLVTPRNIDEIDSRLFKKEQYDLLDSYEDYHLAEADIKEKQIASISRIYRELKITGVFDFANKVESPHIIGQVLSSLVLSPEDELKVIDQVVIGNEKLQLLAKNYCNAKYRAEKMSWLNSLEIASFSPDKRILVLSSIIICKDILDIVIKLPELEQNKYWINTSPWAEDDANTEQTIVGLVSAKRLEYALMILVRMIHDKKLDSPDLAYFVLDANLHVDENVSQTWSYYVEQVLEWLQENMENFDLEKLVHYEWCYYNVFSHEGRAKALEYKLSSSPNDFIFILALLYKSDNELLGEENTTQQTLPAIENDAEKAGYQEKLAKHAWNVLYNWKWVPGVQIDGSFNTLAFNEWINAVKISSAEKGLLDIALQTIGHVLYYSPSSTDELFILQEIAEALEKEENEHMRIGFRTEAFNARGVYNYDPSGKQEDELAKLWIERAKIAEEQGYIRFGKTLRDIAQSFLNQKERY